MSKKDDITIYIIIFYIINRLSSFLIGTKSPLTAVKHKQTNKPVHSSVIENS